MRPALVLLALLTACSSCSIFVAKGRSAGDQHAATVRITATCDGTEQYGSGVLVGDKLALTAAHVVQCSIFPGLPIYVPADKIEVDAGSGPVAAEVDVMAPAADVARLKLDTSMSTWFTPVRVGRPPRVGDRVCEVASVPKLLYRCGEAQAAPSGKIFFDMEIEHGNSGSGLYNASGELVGIVTNLEYCEARPVFGTEGTVIGRAGNVCSGFGTALIGYAWMVPESD